MFVPSEGHSRRARYRSEMENLLSRKELGFELAVTLNFNRPITPAGARQKLEALGQWIDDFYLGRKWADKGEHRVFFVAFLENQNTNPHFHLLLRIPYLSWSRLRQRKFRQFRKLAFHADAFGCLWKELVPSGSCHVRKIYDLNGIVQYNTKQLIRPGYEETFILSTEFHHKSGPKAGKRQQRSR